MCAQKLINNFDILIPLLLFTNKNGFYLIQLIQRRKYNKEIRTNNKILKYYCVDTLNYLKSIKKEIISLCNTCNARVYIILDKKNYKKCYAEMFQILSECLITNNYKIAGINRKLLLDIDSIPESVKDIYFEKIKNYILSKKDTIILILLIK